MKAIMGNGPVSKNRSLVGIVLYDSAVGPASSLLPFLYHACKRKKGKL